MENAEENIRKLLNIPEKYRVLSMMSVGVPKKTKPPHDDTKIEKNRLHFEKF